MAEHGPQFAAVVPLHEGHRHTFEIALIVDEVVFELEIKKRKLIEILNRRFCRVLQDAIAVAKLEPGRFPVIDASTQSFRQSKKAHVALSQTDTFDQVHALIREASEMYATPDDLRIKVFLQPPRDHFGLVGLMCPYAKTDDQAPLADFDQLCMEGL